MGAVARRHAVSAPLCAVSGQVGSVGQTAADRRRRRTRLSRTRGRLVRRAVEHRPVGWRPPPNDGAHERMLLRDQPKTNGVRSTATSTGQSDSNRIQSISAVTRFASDPARPATRAGTVDASLRQRGASMIRGLLRLALVVVIIAVAAAFFFGYRLGDNGLQAPVTAREG